MGTTKSTKYNSSSEITIRHIKVNNFSSEDIKFCVRRKQFLYTNGEVRLDSCATDHHANKYAAVSDGCTTIYGCVHVSRRSHVRSWPECLET